MPSLNVYNSHMRIYTHCYLLRPLLIRCVGLSRHNQHLFKRTKKYKNSEDTVKIFTSIDTQHTHHKWQTKAI